MVIPAEEIHEYARGDVGVRHQDLNAYREVAQRFDTIGEGFRIPSTGIHENSQKYIDPSPIIVVPDENVPAFSVFGLNEGEAFNRDPISMASERTDLGGSLLTYYTNGQIPLVIGNQGWAHPIVTGRRYFIVSVGDTPKIGYPCGVQNGSFGINADFIGFVCLTPTEIKKSVTGVWVTLAQGHNFIAKVEEDITPFNPLTDTLGKGVVRIWTRNNATDVISETPPPDVASFFDIPVKNVIPSLIPKDELTLIHPYSGVGMLAIPLTGTQTFIGWLTSSLAAGTPQTNPGGTAGTGGTTNIELQKLNTSTGIYEDILDDLGVVVKIKAWNSCAVSVDALQRVQGKYISGVPHVDVVCCPVAP